MLIILSHILGVNPLQFRSVDQTPQGTATESASRRSELGLLQSNPVGKWLAPIRADSADRPSGLGMAN